MSKQKKKITTLNYILISRHTENNYVIWLYIQLMLNLHACLTLVVWSAVHHFHWCLATCWKAVLRWNAVYHEHSAVSHAPLTPVPKPELSSQQLNKQANAVPTFVTRWNLYPRVHKIGLWKWLTSFVSVHRYRQNFGCTREWKHASIIIIMPGTGGRLVVSITPLPLYPPRREPLIIIE